MSSQSHAEVSASEAAVDLVPDARRLTDAVTRLRRALRASIRSDYPWETLPMAQVELLQVLGEHSPARVGDLAARQRLAPSTVSGLIGQMMTSGLAGRTRRGRQRGELDPPTRLTALDSARPA